MSGYSYLINFLQSEGYRHEEHETNVSFKFEGVSYFGMRNSDNDYLQIVLICNTKDVDRFKLLEACNAINSQKFAAKLTVTDDSESVWANYEFKPNASTTADDFDSILRLLDHATDEFFKLLRD